MATPVPRNHSGWLDQNQGRAPVPPTFESATQNALSPGWAVEFLLPRGRLIHDDELPDTTGTPYRDQSARSPHGALA
jgi:hypothetical protein